MRMRVLTRRSTRTGSPPTRRGPHGVRRLQDPPLPRWGGLPGEHGGLRHGGVLGYDRPAVGGREGPTRGTKIATSASSRASFPPNRNEALERRSGRGARCFGSLLLRGKCQFAACGAGLYESRRLNLTLLMLYAMVKYHGAFARPSLSPCPVLQGWWRKATGEGHGRGRDRPCVRFGSIVFGEKSYEMDANAKLPEGPLVRKGL